jgi:hypothetical protein
MPRKVCLRGFCIGGRTTRAYGLSDDAICLAIRAGLAAVMHMADDEKDPESKLLREQLRIVELNITGFDSGSSH